MKYSLSATVCFAPIPKDWNNTPCRICLSLYFYFIFLIMNVPELLLYFNLIKRRPYKSNLQIWQDIWSEFISVNPAWKMTVAIVIFHFSQRPPTVCVSRTINSICIEYRISTVLYNDGENFHPEHLCMLIRIKEDSFNSMPLILHFNA